MQERPSLSLVVPVYNEEDRFPERARELADFVRGFPIGSELLVVDDGGTDHTAEVVEAFLAANQTCGPSCSAAPTGGRQRGAGRVGGGNRRVRRLLRRRPLYSPEQLERILEAACAGSVLAIGSRQAAASRLLKRQSPVREWLGKSYNRLVQLTLTPGIADTQCGAKLAETAPVGADPAVVSGEPSGVGRRDRGDRSPPGIEVWETAVEWTNDERSRVRLVRDGVAMVTAVPRILRTVRAIQPGQSPRRLVAIDGSKALLHRAVKRHRLLATVGLGERLPLRDQPSTHKAHSAEGLS